MLWSWGLYYMEGGVLVLLEALGVRRAAVDMGVGYSSWHKPAATCVQVWFQVVPEQLVVTNTRACQSEKQSTHT